MKKSVFPQLYLGLGFAQAAHSVEEALTGLWLRMAVVSGGLHAKGALFPRVAWSAQGFAAANLIIVALLMGLSAFVFITEIWAWKVAWIVAVVETFNGIGHMTAALVRHSYLPGCITGIVLVALSVPLWAVPSIRRSPHGAD